MFQCGNVAYVAAVESLSLGKCLSYFLGGSVKHPPAIAAILRSCGAFFFRFLFPLVQSSVDRRHVRSALSSQSTLRVFPTLAFRTRHLLFVPHTYTMADRVYSLCRTAYVTVARKLWRWCKNDLP